MWLRIRGSDGFKCLHLGCYELQMSAPQPAQPSKAKGREEEVARKRLFRGTRLCRLTACDGDFSRKQLLTCFLSELASKPDLLCQRIVMILPKGNTLFYPTAKQVIFDENMGKQRQHIYKDVRVCVCARACVHPPSETVLKRRMAMTIIMVIIIMIIIIISCFPLLQEAFQQCDWFVLICCFPVCNALQRTWSNAAACSVMLSHCFAFQQCDWFVLICCFPVCNALQRTWSNAAACSVMLSHCFASSVVRFLQWTQFASY